MAKFYLRARSTTLKLLNKYGIEFAVKRKDGISVDGSGKEHITKGGEFNAIGVRQDYKPEEINGLIQAGDIRIVFAPDKVIQIGDLVDIDGMNYRVIQPNPVKPADVVLCYKAQLRK